MYTHKYTYTCTLHVHPHIFEALPQGNVSHIRMEERKGKLLKINLQQKYIKDVFRGL